MLFVINPISGKMKLKNELLDVLDLFTKSGYQVEVFITQKAFDARDIVLERKGSYDIVVCSGGDGTLNEVVSALMQIEERPTLAYIPTGSTNDFASTMMIPKHINEAAQLVVEGTTKLIDIGYFGKERYFTYIACFGIFTEVAHMTPQERKNILGQQAYILEGIKSLSSIKSYPMKIITDKEEIEDEFLFGMVTNTSYVGGFKRLVQQEIALDDGYFEVLLIKFPQKATEYTNIISGLLFHEEHEYIYRLRCKTLRIETQEAVDWVLDGEYGGCYQEIEIENIKRCIKLKC